MRERFWWWFYWLIEMLEDDDGAALPAGWWLLPMALLGAGALVCAGLLWGVLAALAMACIAGLGAAAVIFVMERR